MGKLACPILLILAISLLLPACSDQTAERGPNEVVAPDAAIKKGGGEDDLQYHLRRVWEAADAAIYDVISFPIAWATGGSMRKRPGSWESEYPDRFFGLTFPPQSWDRAVYGDVLMIEIWVPILRTVFPCPTAPMFFELHAVGHPDIEFNTKVTLEYSFHPSLDPWCGQIFLLNYDKVVYPVWYVVNEIALSPVGPGDPKTRDPACGISRTAEIGHFSRWHTTDQEPGDKGLEVILENVRWPCE